MQEPESLYKIQNVAWILGFAIDIPEAEKLWKMVSQRSGAIWLTIDKMSNQEVTRKMMKNLDLFK